ncbi:MAG: ubiquinol-cytochrome c reductase iron-sulfur subunit [Burkholderiales bacterium PBB4]|nr:MAG: ubiquinol-cytochrome c reductase iron-sulfur subunit [Burkholderiales bacterium PBB4]
MSDSPVDQGRRTWVAITAGAGAIGGVSVAVPFVSTFTPSERAKAAGAPVEADKNDAQLADPKSLRKADELTPAYARYEGRSIKPEYLVAVGICSHLGCSPSDKFQAGAQPSLPDDWQGGFLCPCHGSTFDMAGRVFKNKPAPDNLEVPPHLYITETRLLIGEDKKA